MAIVRFIQGKDKKNLNLTSEGLQFIKKFCDNKSSAQDILKACCAAGVCPVVLNYKLR